MDGHDLDVFFINEWREKNKWLIYFHSLFTCCTCFRNVLTPRERLCAMHCITIMSVLMNQHVVSNLTSIHRPDTSALPCVPDQAKYNLVSERNVCRSRRCATLRILPSPSFNPITL
jgi:hypothetical protein